MSSHRDHYCLVFGKFLGGKPRGIALRALNVIPHSRGLGSSASAIVGGLSLARALVLGGSERMSDDDMLNLASAIEGHPDNVAAAGYPKGHSAELFATGASECE